MNIKNKKDVTIIDFTIKVENKIKEIYPTKENQEKALLLIYLINRADGLGYQLNVRNHRAFFGNLNGVKWTALFEPLVSNNLINCTSPHQAETKSKTYTTTKQYKWKANTGEIKRRFYGEEYISMPEYIQKFHLDNHLVVNPNKSLWSGNYQYISKTEINEDMEHTIQVMQNQMLMMQEMIDLMQMENEKKISELYNKNMEIEKILKVKEEQIKFLLQEVEDLKNLKNSGISSVSAFSIELPEVKVTEEVKAEPVEEPKTFDPNAVCGEDEEENIEVSIAVVESQHVGIPAIKETIRMNTTYDAFIELLVSKGYKDTQSVIDLTCKRYVNATMPDAIKHSTINNIVGAVNRIINGN